jgi:hypothetical protein
MTPLAAQDDTERRLDELVALERDAWERYLEELRPLGQQAYDHTEPTAWDALQATLAEVLQERDELSAAVPHASPGH